MRYRLSKRLFGITLSLMLVLMFLTYFAQAFLFEKFYSYKRTMSLVHEVNKFSTLYSMHISEPAEIYPVLKKFGAIFGPLVRQVIIPIFPSAFYCRK